MMKNGCLMSWGLAVALVALSAAVGCDDAAADHPQPLVEGVNLEPVQPEAPGEGPISQAPDGTGDAVDDAPDGTGDQAAPGADDRLGALGFVAATERQEELRGIAMSALMEGDNNLSIAALISLMETSELSDLKASGMLMLADLYSAEGDGDRAVEILGFLLEQAPALVEFEYMMARTLGDLDRLPEAAQHMLAAVELDPEFLPALTGLGALYIRMEQEEDAAQAFARYETRLAAILVRLNDTTAEPMDRIGVMETLMIADPDQRVTDAFVALLAEDNLLINAGAIQVLMETGTLNSVEALTTYAARTELPVELRQAALQAAQYVELRGEVGIQAAGAVAP